MSSPTSPWDLAADAAQVLHDRLGPHDAAVVLGSGWSIVADDLGEHVAQLPLSEVPAAAATTVPGHPGVARSVRAADGRRVLVLLGRVHLYEGHAPSTVVHLCRAAVLAGAGSVVLTNAAGSLDPGSRVGSVVVIGDQLNLTGTDPLVGDAPPGAGGSRFVDLSDLYDRDWRGRLGSARPDLDEGVYAGVVGGSFETPAEIRAMAALGADLVGMSTVLEAIAAHHLGARVLGLSLVTNLAAGLQPTIDHREVLGAAQAASHSLAGVLTTAVATAPTGPGSAPA